MIDNKPGRQVGGIPTPFQFHYPQAGGFTCPSDNCGTHKSKVLDNRRTVEGFARRRRQCNTCGHIFLTVEVTLDMFE